MTHKLPSASRLRGRPCLPSLLLASCALAGAAHAVALDVGNLDGSNGFVLFGAEQFDSAGIGVGAAGDINGDGIGDMVVGAFSADGPGNSRQAAGDSYVVFGRADGFAATIDLGTMNGTDGFVLHGTNNLDASGCSVSGAGDVNNDGFDDLVIGARDADGPSNGRNAAGETYVVFGKASGLGAAFDLATLAGGDGSNGFVVFGAEEVDQSARSVSAAGDVNGDGFADIVIGAIYGDGPSNGRTDAGEAYIVFGKASGFGATIDLATLAAPDGVTLFGAGANDLAGISVSTAGDVNGDGVADVVVGAMRADGPANGRTDCGDSYVVFGNAAGFPSTIDLAALDGNDGFVLHGVDGNDTSGKSVSSAGDMNGDGFDDLLVGASTADGLQNSPVDAGDTYVVFGKAASFGASFDLATLESGNGSAGFDIHGIDFFDNSGVAVSGAGDMDGDGFADLLVGAWRADSLGNGRADAGETYVVYGKETGFGSSILLQDILEGDGSGGFVLDGLDAGDYSAVSVSRAGDVNGDGLADVIVGAFDGGGPSNGRPYGGEAYVVLGSGNGDSATYKSFAKAGDAPSTKVGDSRARIAFAGGDDASLQTVTLHRTAAAVTGIPAAGVAWEVSTDRAGWSAATVAFRYTDAEIGGFDEALLRLYKAPSPSGPWTELATGLDADRNTATATVSSFSWFVLALPGAVPGQIDGIALY